MARFAGVGPITPGSPSESRIPPCLSGRRGESADRDVPTRIGGAPERTPLAPMTPTSFSSNPLGRDEAMDVSPGPAAVVLDVAHLRDVCGGDLSFESLVIGEYRKAAASAIEELAAAVADGDQPRIKAWAHSIKGSSATLGAVTLPKLCQTLESLATGPWDADSAATLLEHVRAAHGALERVLREHLGETG